MKKIVLQSNLVDAGILKSEPCPVCGDEKSRDAGSCLQCFRALGGTPEVKASIRAAIQAIRDAYKGMYAANAGNVARDTVEKPVFAMVKVPKNAQAMKSSDVAKAKGVKDYLKVVHGVKGGVVEMFVFSEDGIENIPLGGLIPGILSFRTREGKNGGVGYLRVQVVNGDVVADSQLLVTSDEALADRLFRDDLPDMEFREPCLTRKAFVGFKALGRPASNKEVVAA